ncbi:glycosyltransferase family 2 protein [Spirosoma aureum]|uniref:Glycosyltransferase family 2 protein n=1 Tax=Spirosoma aureum TaxID=2692134 RepID=A0A6G9AHU5_9BACT|nr:glycosyltransferase family 2 protein [Spirosoma aureum]QIP12031.1 glycosyltransferase family 2 protein [Spirosoma aureum]
MISICLATYNGAKYIVRQIESILPQLLDEDEIIISDDNSTDNTLQLISSIQDSRIKLIKNMKGKGPIANFESALNNANGDFIFLCDQDDVWFVNKIEVMKNELKKYDLVLSDCEVVNENLEVLIPSFFYFRNSRAGFFYNIYKNSYMGCCMAFRRDVLKYALPFPKSIHMHDWWIGLLVELRGSVGFIDRPLMKYVRHGNNASPTGEASQYSFIVRTFNRLLLLVNLLVRWFK